MGLPTSGPTAKIFECRPIVRRSPRCIRRIRKAAAGFHPLRRRLEMVAGMIAPVLNDIKAIAA
jgi:hypothetical protein